MHDISEYPLKGYGRWAGNGRGSNYRPEQCAEEVRGPGSWPTYHQCARKPGHGDRGLFCKQHSRETPKDKLWLVEWGYRGVSVKQLPAENRKKTWKVNGQVVYKTESGVMKADSLPLALAFYGEDRDAIIFRIREILASRVEKANTDVRQFIRGVEHLETQ